MCTQPCSPVGIDDHTLADFKTRLPFDRQLLAKLVDAIDAAGARVIGLDLFFTHPTPPDNENLLIDAIRRCRAKVVLVAADERIDLSSAQRSRQSAFLAEAGRPAGYGNVATERDWVVRFFAQPARESKFPKSFAQLLAQEADSTADTNVRRIAWLKMPADGSETFLTISAETLLLPAGAPLVAQAREALKDKIVIPMPLGPVAVP
jgi:CHASE2 domain-containing sensor protein